MKETKRFPNQPIAKFLTSYLKFSTVIVLYWVIGRKNDTGPLTYFFPVDFVPQSSLSYILSRINVLDQCFFASLMLWPSNTVPHILLISPQTKNIMLLLYNCKFATIISHNVNICYVMFNWGGDPQFENHCLRGIRRVTLYLWDK